MNELDHIAEAIRAEFETKTAARDDALAQSRSLVRYCADTIKAIHRADWDSAQAGLARAREAARGLSASVADYPDLYHAGYTQDALKELVEAFATYALVRGEALPSPEALDVPGATYLNGLAEAASELRRSILDIIRQGHDEQAEHLLEMMDTAYNLLMTFDFPDVITGGLRRRVDNLRGVLNRTRGDLTTSLRQHQLRVALERVEARLKVGEGRESDGG
jgi:translin